MPAFPTNIAASAARWCRRSFAMVACAGLLLAPAAMAASQRTDLLSGAGRADGSGWQASPNGVDGWIPAYGPYPNPVTMPNPHINPEGVHANLMWYWPGPGLPAPGSPPTTAYFRYQLNLEPGLLPQIVALVAADDQMTLTVNGVTIGSYELAAHMPNGQPEAVVMDLTPGLQPGANLIEIRATDTGSYHWVFFDSYNIMASPQRVLVKLAPVLTSLIGDMDDFHGGDPADTAPRSQHVIDMQDHLVAAPAINLDQPAVNRSVGLSHDATLPDGALITSATVKLHVRMTGDIPDNDVILFNESNVPEQGQASRVIALHDLLGFPPQSGAIYDVTWNLAKTPLRNFTADAVTGQPDQVVNLLPMLKNAQHLDVLLADDTMVDFSQLSITYTTVDAASGDLNNDGAVDRDDLNILLLGLNTVASASNDPRDLDHDGRITVLDVRKLVASCTRALCGK